MTMISFRVRDIEPESSRLLTKLLTDPAGQGSTNPVRTRRIPLPGPDRTARMSTEWTRPDWLDGPPSNLGSGRATGWGFQSSCPHQNELIRTFAFLNLPGFVRLPN